MQQSIRSGDAKPARESVSTPIRTPDKSRPRFGPDLQAQIGDQLRAMHHDVLNEKIPDRFLRLLEQLARKETEDT